MILEATKSLVASVEEGGGCLPNSFRPWTCGMSHLPKWPKFKGPGSSFSPASSEKLHTERTWAFQYVNPPEYNWQASWKVKKAKGNQSNFHNHNPFDTTIRLAMGCQRNSLQVYFLASPRSGLQKPPADHKAYAILQAGSALFSARKGLMYEYMFKLYKMYEMPSTPLEKAGVFRRLFTKGFHPSVAQGMLGKPTPGQDLQLLSCRYGLLRCCSRGQVEST